MGLEIFSLPSVLCILTSKCVYWYKVKANNISIQRSQTSGNLESSLATQDNIQKSYLDLFNKSFIVFSIILCHYLVSQQSN